MCIKWIVLILKGKENRTDYKRNRSNMTVFSKRGRRSVIKELKIS